jgi:hypothetical protein
MRGRVLVKKLGAALLIEAPRKMSELLYHPYFLALWQLTCLEEKWPTTQDFRNLVIELGKGFQITLAS